MAILGKAGVTEHRFVAAKQYKPNLHDFNGEVRGKEDEEEEEAGTRKNEKPREKKHEQMPLGLRVKV